MPEEITREHLGEALYVARHARAAGFSGVRVDTDLMIHAIEQSLRPRSGTDDEVECARSTIHLANELVVQEREIADALEAAGVPRREARSIPRQVELRGQVADACLKLCERRAIGHALRDAGRGDEDPCAAIESMAEETAALRANVRDLADERDAAVARGALPDLPHGWSQFDEEKFHGVLGPEGRQIDVSDREVSVQRCQRFPISVMLFLAAKVWCAR